MLKRILKLIHLSSNHIILSTFRCTQLFLDIVIGREKDTNLNYPRNWINYFCQRIDYNVIIEIIKILLL